MPKKQRLLEALSKIRGDQKLPFTKIPNKLIAIGLSSRAFHVAVYLLSNGERFDPSQRLMARILGLDKNTIARALRELQSKNILIATGKFKSIYEFVSPKYWSDFPEGQLALELQSEASEKATLIQEQQEYKSSDTQVDLVELKQNPILKLILEGDLE